MKGAVHLMQLHSIIHAFEMCLSGYEYEVGLCNDVVYDGWPSLSPLTLCSSPRGRGRGQLISLISPLVTPHCRTLRGS